MSQEPSTRKTHQADKAHEGGAGIPDQEARSHPEKYQDDLNAAPLSGVNFGLEGPHPEEDAPTADEFKEMRERFPQFRKDELRELPILPLGSRLEQGAKYFDLYAPSQDEITATGDMTASEHHRYVPKSEVDYQLWNRLIGVENPERTGEANDRAT